MTVWHAVIQEPKREREPVTESYQQCWTTIAVNSDYLLSEAAAQALSRRDSQARNRATMQDERERAAWRDGYNSGRYFAQSGRS